MKMVLLKKPLASYIRHFSRQWNPLESAQSLWNDLNLIFRYYGRRLLLRSSSWPGSSQKSRRKEIAYVLVVINLQDRADRRSLISQHLDDLSIPAVFSPGVRHESGAIGCGLAHLLALESRRSDETELIIITEDDLEFLASRRVIEEILSEFCANEALDVLCIGNNVKGNVIPVSRGLGITSNTQTTSCYAVKTSSRELIIENFRDAVENLKAGKKRSEFAIDIHWKRLQRSKLIFSVPNRKIAQQRESFSDIEKKWVKYER